MRSNLRPCRRPLTALALLVLSTSLPLSGQDGGGSGSATASSPAAPRSSVEEGERRQLELTLEEAIRLAFAHNLDLQIERVAEERSLRDVRIADAAFDPLFRTGYTISRFRQPSVSFLDFGSSTSTIAVNSFDSDNWNLGVSGLLETGATYSLTTRGSRGDNPDSSIFSLNPRYNSDIELQLTQPLLRSFGEDSVLADLRIASRNTAISRLELRRRVEDTLVAVGNAYWDLLFARKDLEVKEQALVEATELLEINRRKQQVGTGTEFDVIDAEANVETQRGGIIDARNARENAQDTLLDLINAPRYRRLGSPLLVEIDLVPVTEPDLESVSLSVEDSVEQALANRPEIEQSALAILNAEDVFRRAEDDVQPRLDLVGTWSNSGLEGDLGGAYGELGSGTYYDWSLGLVLEIPFGNQAAIGRREQADLDRSSARLQRERTVNGIVLGVTQAVRGVRSAQQRVLTTQAATRLRTEQLDGEKRRLTVGLSTSYQVLQIQNDLLEAQTAEVQSSVQLLKAMTEYRRQTGEVLELFGIELE